MVLARSCVLIVLLSLGKIFAQNSPVVPPRSKTDQALTTYKAGTNLVLVPVVVTDKQGQSIGRLTRNDFEIFDRGKPQNIVSFSAVTRSQVATESQRPAISSSETTDTSLKSVSDSAIRGESGKRSIVYLVDDFNSDLSELASIRSAMSQHIRILKDTDRAAIYTFSGRPELDFTADHTRLEETIAKLRERPIGGHDESKECPNVTVYLAHLIMDNNDPGLHDALVQHTVSCAHIAASDPKAAEAMAETIFLGAARRQLIAGEQQTSVALRTLRLAVRRLANMDGERLIILTSPGFYAQSPQAAADRQHILEMATARGIVISALNDRGLYTGQSGADDERQTSGAWHNYERQSAQADEGLLRELAKDTGGLYVHDNDDFRSALDHLATPPEFSYVIGFASTDAQGDGKFHPIKVRLINGKGLTVEARSGYYSLQEDATKQSARLEIDDAVFSHEERRELPVVFQTGYVEPNKGDPTITAIVKLNVSSLHFRVSNQHNLDTVTVVATIFADDGSYVAGTSKTVNLRLQDETLKTAPAVTLPFAFHVKRGAYSIRLVLRDSQSGAMTTITRPEKIT